MRINGKKFLSLALALVMVLGMLPATAGAATPANGSCGDNVTWNLTADGKLTISGTGAMTDYSSSSVPWYDQRTDVTSVTIGSGVTSIGSGIFMGCNNLTSVTIPSSVTSIGMFAFKECSVLGSVSIPNSVTKIGSYAFSDCWSLASVIIPASVTNIGSGAFSNCIGLTNVTIHDGVTSIGDSAFYNCIALTSVTIPNSVTTIGTIAFETCTSLTSVTISDGVTSIGEGAFKGCTKLTGVTIPSSVTSIGDYAFQNCTGVTAIQVDDNNQTYASVDGVVFTKDTKTLVAYPSGKLGAYTIPDGVTSIGDYAFIDCAGLTSVTIPDGMTSIGSHAFIDCAGLTSVTIPEGVTSLGIHAFSGCSGLTSVTIPSSVTSIGDYAFNGTGLTTVDYGGTEAQWNSISIGTNNDPLTSANITYTVPTPDPDVPIAITYTLSFDAGEGTGGPADLKQTDNKVFTIPAATPTRSGYTFTGWADKDSVIYQPGGTLTIPDGDQLYILSAVWHVNSTTDNPSTDPDPVPSTDPDPVPSTDPDPKPSTDPEPKPSTDPEPRPSRDPSPAPGPSPSGSPVIGNITADDMEEDGPDTEPAPVPDLGASPIQGEAVKEDPAVTWFERLETKEEAVTLYETMSGEQGAGTGTPSIFEEEKHFTLPARSTGGSSGYHVDEISCVDFTMLDVYAGENGGLDSTIFTDEKFFTVPATDEDRKVDFGKLQPGDMVRTANFNGVYVTSRPRDDQFDTAKTEACEYIAAVFHAFDRDCPEIFWLSGKCRVRIMVATDPVAKTQTAYFFLVTVDKEGFTMLSPAWLAEGSIEAGIKRRDAAVENILATVTAGDTLGKVKQLNKWLTENNQYNTTADLNTISNEPHECLAALEGKIAADGPVCDGYSRAMKVLCDQLKIPCVLVTGWARPSKAGGAGFHMWNSIQMGDAWYAADITWDDPSVKDFVGAKSGRENENFLLVGANTVVYNMAFSVSHVEQNQAAAGGVLFNNGPVLSANAFGQSPASTGIPATGTAVARTQTVKLDGRDVEFQAYAVKDTSGNETNYVKLRDLAVALNGTKAQFNVSWDGKIGITSNTAYEAVGGEGTTPYTGDQPYRAVSDTPVRFNGSDVKLTSFSITHQGGGYTYYKLRDLGQLLNFNVTWNGKVVVESDKPYTG